MKQILKFLGRGSAFNVQEGNTSAYIKEEETLLLIDCGEDIFQKIIKTNLLNEIKDVHVLITHLNSDHVASLSSLIFYCYYVKKIKVNTYFPTNELKLYLQLNGNTEEQYNFKQVQTYKSIGNIALIRFISVPHIINMSCYGIEIEYKNKLIYYSGDSNDIPKLNISSDIDEFYQDTCLADYEGNVHLSLRKLCESIPQELRNRVFCMHIDNNELIEKAKAEGFNVVEVERN